MVALARTYVRNHHPLLRSRMMLMLITTMMASASAGRLEGNRVVAHSSDRVKAMKQPRDPWSPDSAVLEMLAAFRILTHRNPKTSVQVIVDTMICYPGQIDNPYEVISKLRCTGVSPER